MTPYYHSVYNKVFSTFGTLSSPYAQCKWTVTLKSTGLKIVHQPHAAFVLKTFLVSIPSVLRQRLRLRRVLSIFEIDVIRCSVLFFMKLKVVLLEV
jgi:hypothetical protein